MVYPSSNISKFEQSSEYAILEQLTTYQKSELMTLTVSPEFIGLLVGIEMNLSNYFVVQFELGC